MKIAFVSYYKRESFNLSASDGTRENGNLRFLRTLINKTGYLVHGDPTIIAFSKVYLKMSYLRI